MARQILSHSSSYTAAVLGSQVSDYLKWLQKKESWGGEEEGILGGEEEGSHLYLYEVVVHSPTMFVCIYSKVFIPD